jgi:hypothetical protein
VAHETSDEASGGILDRMRRIAGGAEEGGHPHAWQMGRDLRRLLREREQRLRDLGGLALEMVRHDRVRPELIAERGRDVLALEARIRHLGELHEEALRSQPEPAEACACGAPAQQGARFCASCGRPVAGAWALLECRMCGRPLAADSNFCSFCGTSLETEEIEPAVR